MVHAFIPAALVGLVVFAVSTVQAAEPKYPDVAKLPSHPELPDPLIMFSGDRVTTKEQWTEKRRPDCNGRHQRECEECRRRAIQNLDSTTSVFMREDHERDHSSAPIQWPPPESTP